MGWLIAAGVLFLLAILPVGISALYNEDGPSVNLLTVSRTPTLTLSAAVFRVLL